MRKQFALEIKPFCIYINEGNKVRTNGLSSRLLCGVEHINKFYVQYLTVDADLQRPRLWLAHVVVRGAALEPLAVKVPGRNVEVINLAVFHIF